MIVTHYKQNNLHYQLRDMGWMSQYNISLFNSKSSPATALFQVDKDGF